MSLLPTFLIRPVVALAGWLGSLGFSIPPLGVRPYPFGTAMITSVGMLGLDLAFVPQTPFARVPFIVMVGAIGPKPVVATEGPQAGQVVACDILPLTVTVDHRFLDGKDGAKMAVRLKHYLEHPEHLEPVAMK